MVAFPLAVVAGAAIGIALALAGCLPEPESGGPPPPGGPDAGVIIDDEPDASPGGGADAGGSQSACAVEDDYGNMGPLPGAQAEQANQSGSMGHEAPQAKVLLIFRRGARGVKRRVRPQGRAAAGAGTRGIACVVTRR